jgi:hypothetical protein
MRKKTKALKYIRQAVTENTNTGFLLPPDPTLIVLRGKTLYRALCEASDRGYNLSVPTEDEAFKVLADATCREFKVVGRDLSGNDPKDINVYADSPATREFVFGLLFPLELYGVHAHWGPKFRETPIEQSLRFSLMGVLLDLPAWVLDEAWVWEEAAEPSEAA